MDADNSSFIMIAAVIFGRRLPPRRPLESRQATCLGMVGPVQVDQNRCQVSTVLSREYKLLTFTRFKLEIAPVLEVPSVIIPGN